MACFHPLPAIKSMKRIVAKDGHIYNPLTIGSRYDTFEPFVNPDTGELCEPFSIPCGYCAGCCMDKSKAWADRCSLEYLESDPENCFFVTLTIDPDHLEKYRIFEKPNGELVDYDLFTLDKELLTKFKKDLLARFQYYHNHTGVRFFACGEYGGKNHRPHFHIILFNAPLKDLEYWSSHKVGTYDIQIYRSKFIEACWDLGFVWIERYDWNNAAYVARYTQKKSGILSKDAKQIYVDNGIEPEFLNMSRKPGIGVPFFESNIDKFYKGVYRDVVDEDGNFLYKEQSPLSIIMPAHGSKEASTLKIPRLFDIKFELEIREYLNAIRYSLDHGDTGIQDIIYEVEQKILNYNKYKQIKIENAKAIERTLLADTDLDPYEYQDLVAEASSAAYKLLTRNNF